MGPITSADPSQRQHLGGFFLFLFPNKSSLLCLIGRKEPWKLRLPANFSEKISDKNPHPIIPRRR
jgi:hypothetical protein